MDWILVGEALKMFPQPITATTVRSWAKRGIVRSKQFAPGGRIYIYKPDVEAMLAKPPVSMSSTIISDTPSPGF